MVEKHAITLETSFIFPTWIPLVSIFTAIGLWWNDYEYPMDFLCVFTLQETIFWYVTQPYEIFCSDQI